MLFKELERIVREENAKGSSNPYIRSALKEYLQVYVLYFIYTSAAYSKNLIFTGGTCLRHFYGLDRLSEDVDFDFVEDVGPDELRKGLETFFVSRYKYERLGAAVKQKGQQILLKFPVLKELGLTTGNESDLLYVKIDLSPTPSHTHSVIVTSGSLYGFNYAARHYDLPDLMAGKLHAILTRRHLKGKENRVTVKGRDFYDLLWFMKKGVKPSIARLSEMLGKEIAPGELGNMLDARVHVFIQRHLADFKVDMGPLISNKDFIPMYVDNYLAEYERLRPELCG